jgi:hypothetical protein
MHRRPVAVYRVVDEGELFGEQAQPVWRLSSDAEIPIDATRSVSPDAAVSLSALAPKVFPIRRLARRNLAGVTALSLLGLALLLVALGGRERRDRPASHSGVSQQIAVSTRSLSPSADQRVDAANLSLLASTSKPQHVHPARHPTIVAGIRAAGLASFHESQGLRGESPAAEFGFER